MEFVSFIKTSFQILCMTATIFFMVMWMQTFLLDEDTTTIENRSFFKTENDKLPVLSMCFEQSFENISFPEMGEGVNIARYSNHLGGKYFDKRFTGIDYYTVSMNISEFIIGYDVEFINGTRFKHSNYNVSFNRPYHTYSFASWGRIVKCFGLEITDSEVAGIAIHFKRDIFPNMMRPQQGGFVTLVHYPGQMIKSGRTEKKVWDKRDNLTDFKMAFSVKWMEANIHRYKSRSDNCIKSWTRYDNIMIQNHINKVGCKSPLFGSEYNGTVCMNKDDHKKARFRFSSIRKLKPPCQEIASVDYTTADEVIDENEKNKKFLGKYLKSYVTMKLRIPASQYKAIVQKKAVDFQSLIGYIGGYIGIFTGFALAQAPDLIVTIVIFARKGCKIMLS